MKSSILILIITLLTISKSEACDCLMSSLGVEIEETEIILKVKVTQILDTENEREEYLYPNYSKTNNKVTSGFRVKLNILEIFKGKFTHGETIDLESNFSNCEFKYQSGNEYILFLKKENDEFFLKPCSYSEITSTSKHSNRLHKKISKYLKRQKQ